MMTYLEVVVDDDDDDDDDGILLVIFIILECFLLVYGRVLQYCLPPWGRVFCTS
jgi:hypothetical protein